MKTLDELVDFITRTKGVSFVEIRDFIEDPGGTVGLHLPGRPNTLLWIGLSDEGAALIQDLLKDDRVEIQSTHILVYLVDGCIPTLPLAKRPGKTDYKKEHWLPVAFSPTASHLKKVSSSHGAD